MRRLSTTCVVPSPRPDRWPRREVCQSALLRDSQARGVHILRSQGRPVRAPERRHAAISAGMQLAMGMDDPGLQQEYAR
jgi:hypothetical protein